MKKIIKLVIYAFLPFLLTAQDKGIQFEQGISWQQVLEKAKAEHKAIFVDCFTTWCGPCKMMSEKIFPLEEVGNYFNHHFINVQLQLDSTANDNAAVKNWYAAGHEIEKKYAVNSYPTYLFFDESGEVVHRCTYSFDGVSFIEKAKDAMSPETQYYRLLGNYKKGQRDSAFLNKLTNEAMDADNISLAYETANQYLATQTNLLTWQTLRLINIFTRSSKDPGFTVMLNHPSEVDQLEGIWFAENAVQKIIMTEDVFSKKMALASGVPNWKVVSVELPKKYPALAAEVIARSKVSWYQRRNDWKNYQLMAAACLKKFGSHLPAAELNTYAFTTFNHCKKVKDMVAALAWSKRTCDYTENKFAPYLKTYANLMYRLGKTNEAITWAKKALSVADANDRNNCQATIEKMNKGEKTWSD